MDADRTPASRAYLQAYETSTFFRVLGEASDADAADRLFDADAARVVVIGAGFIGLEVAATARKLGNDVTVLEGLPAPLIRGLGAELGATVGGIHEPDGVVLRCAVSVADLEAGGRQSLRFQFRLDSSQLPRTFQLGNTGQSAWAVGVERQVDLTQESLR